MQQQERCLPDDTAVYPRIDLHGIKEPYVEDGFQASPHLQRDLHPLHANDGTFGC